MAPKAFPSIVRPSVRPSDRDTMINTALEYMASSSGKNCMLPIYRKDHKPSTSPNVLFTPQPTCWRQNPQHAYILKLILFHAALPLSLHQFLRCVLVSANLSLYMEHILHDDMSQSQHHASKGFIFCSNLTSVGEN